MRLLSIAGILLAVIVLALGYGTPDTRRAGIEGAGAPPPRVQRSPPVADPVVAMAPSPPTPIEATPVTDPAIAPESSADGDAWAAVSPLQGRHALLDPGAAFDAARDGAAAGDPDALLDLAFAIENCHAAGNFPTRADLDAFLRTRPYADPDEVEALAALIPTCRRMVEAAPEGLRLEAWSRRLRADAAAAGQPLARFLAVDLRRPTQAAYETAVAALSAAVAEASPFAWREAAEFLLAFPSPARSDPYRVEASAWLLLSCRGDAACDAGVLEARIAEVQLPTYAEEIFRRSEALRAAVDAGEAFDLDTGWRAPDAD